MDKSGEVAERDGATLRLKEGGAFYAPSPLLCIAVHWPKLVAGAQSGELYHRRYRTEVEEPHAGLGGWPRTTGGIWVWGPRMSHREGVLAASRPQRLC